MVCAMIWYSLPSVVVYPVYDERIQTALIATIAMPPYATNGGICSDD